MRALTRISALIAWAAIAATAGAGTPQYEIFDIGVVQVSHDASQGFDVSPGGVAVGRSIQGSSASQAFTWTLGGGVVGLPNLAGRNHAVSNSANDNGIVVGTASTTLFGTGRLPVIWQNGAVTQLPLPSGETFGDAHGVNASGVAAGSVDGGSLQQAVIYSGGTATVITQTTPTGCFFVTAFGINNFGRIVGQGIDPNNAARNVGIVYDMGSAEAFEVGALPGFNGALAFAVGNNGHVVGSSMLNQGSGLPFIYSDAVGMIAIPLAAGTSQGSARGVNSAGWVVGQDSSAFSIPFLWDGSTTYRLADLLPPGSGWDLDMNTSSSALGISDNGIIVGTGVHNGETHGYAMVPVTGTPTPIPAIDLGITMTDSPDPVQVGHDLTYTITILNNVPDTALNVTMTDALPPGVNYVSATPSQGSCTGTSTVTCNLGTIPSSGSATVILVVTPTVAGQLINTAVVPFPGDPNPSNNSATQVTTVLPAGTPTPTPSPATPTPTPNQCAYVFLDEDFDGVTAPALPPGWVSSFTPGVADCTTPGACQLGANWTTSTITPYSPPNSAFHDAPSCVTDSSLYSPLFHNGVGGDMLLFEHNYDLQSGFDGAVLEISINGGPFTDFVAAGGSFTGGSGYNGTISTAFQSPIAGRPAWTGNSEGYRLAIAMMPSGAGNVVLRFRVATDCSVASTGWRLDDIKVVFLVPCPTPTPTGTPPSPTPTTPSPTPTPTPTATPTPTPTATPTPTSSPTPAAQALNLSTRMRVQAGDNVGIGGFIITPSTGSGPSGPSASSGPSGGKRVLLRGIGPSLSAFGVPDALADPVMELHGPAGFITFTNDNWRDTQEAEIEATGIPPTNNLESAIVMTLPPGQYTAIVSGKNNSSGVALIEAYDLNQAVDAKLANISTRAFVGTGSNVVIAGFILGGDSGATGIVLRGIGPSLTSFGVPNALANPTLGVYNSNGALLIGNNDWQDDPAQAAIISAAGLAPTNNLESGIAATLSPGQYTGVLAGLDNGTGVGLVEVYDLGEP